MGCAAACVLDRTAAELRCIRIGCDVRIAQRSGIAGLVGNGPVSAKIVIMNRHLRPRQGVLRRAASGSV